MAWSQSPCPVLGELGILFLQVEEQSITRIPLPKSIQITATFRQPSSPRDAAQRMCASCPGRSTTCAFPRPCSGTERSRLVGLCLGISRLPGPSVVPYSNVARNAYREMRDPLSIGASWECWRKAQKGAQQRGERWGTYKYLCEAARVTNPSA